MKTQQIPLDLVDEDRDVRGDVDVSDLVEAFRRVGQIHPILVSERDGRFKVKAGHRRTRAARLLKWSEIAAVVSDRPEDVLEEAAIYENLARKNLSLRVTAREIARLKELHSREPGEKRFTKEVAERTGVGERTVQRLAKLGSSATDEVLEAIDAGKLSKAKGERIASLPPEEQREALRDETRSHVRLQLGVREAAVLLDIIQGEILFHKGLPFEDEDVVRSLEERLKKVMK